MVVFYSLMWSKAADGMSFFLYCYCAFMIFVIRVFLVLLKNLLAVLSSLRILGSPKEGEQSLRADEKEKEDDLAKRIESVADAQGFIVNGIYIGFIEKKPEKLETMYFGFFSKGILVFNSLVDTCTNLEIEAYMYQEIHDWVVLRDSKKIIMDFTRDFLYVFLLSNIFHYEDLCSNFLMPDHLFVRFEISLFLVTPVYYITWLIFSFITYALSLRTSGGKITGFRQIERLFCRDTESRLEVL